MNGRIGQAVAACALFAAAGARGQEGQAVDVDIPAGALPSGPATAELTSQGGDSPVLIEWPVHQIRFQMPAGGISLRMWPGPFIGDAQFTVRARSDSGATWEAHNLPKTTLPNAGKRLFIGTADQLGALSHAAHLALPDEADDLINGLELTPEEFKPEPGCTEFTAAKVAILADPPPGSAAALRRCATLGAVLLVIGDDSFALPDLSAGRGTPWGSGRYGWARAVDRTAAAALRDVLRRPVDRGLFHARMPFHLLSEPPADNEPTVDRNQILGLLAVYVVALGMVGAWGVRRSKRSIVLWLALPATALGASAAVALAAAATDHEVSHLDTEVSDVVAPDGDGIEYLALQLHARAPETFDLALPWTSGSLDFFHRERGFSGPFMVNSGPPTAIEDRTQGRLEFPRLHIAHRSQANLQLTQAITGTTSILRTHPGEIEVVNPTPYPIAHAALFAGGKRRFVDDIPANGHKAFPSADASDSAPGWLGHLSAQRPEDWLDPGAYLLASQTIGNGVPSIAPAIDSQVKRIVMTIGPLPEPRR